MCFCLEGNFEAFLSSSFSKIHGKLSTVAKLRVLTLIQELCVRRIITFELRHDLIQASFNNCKMQPINPFLKEFFMLITCYSPSFFSLTTTSPTCLLVVQESESLFFLRERENVEVFSFAWAFWGFGFLKWYSHQNCQGVCNKVFDMYSQEGRCQLFVFLFKYISLSKVKVWLGV